MAKKKNQPGFKKLKLNKIKQAEYNPRVISPEAMAGLKESINRFGCVEPIIVNVRSGRNVIVGGHQRYEALVSQGVTECVCVTVDLSIKEEKALNLTLNNPAIQGEFIPGLDEYIDELRAEMNNEEAFYDLRINELKTEIGNLAARIENIREWL